MGNCREGSNPSFSAKSFVNSVFTLFARLFLYPDKIVTFQKITLNFNKLSSIATPVATPTK